MRDERDVISAEGSSPSRAKCARWRLFSARAKPGLPDPKLLQAQLDSPDLVLRTAGQPGEILGVSGRAPSSLRREVFLDPSFFLWQLSANPLGAEAFVERRRPANDGS